MLPTGINTPKALTTKTRREIKPKLTNLVVSLRKRQSNRSQSRRKRINHGTFIGRKEKDRKMNILRNNHRAKILGIRNLNRANRLNRESSRTGLTDMLLPQQEPASIVEGKVTITQNAISQGVNFALGVECMRWKPKTAPIVQKTSVRLPERAGQSSYLQKPLFTHTL